MNGANGSVNSRGNQTALAVWALVDRFGILLNERRTAEDIAPDRLPAALARLATTLLMQTDISG